MAGPIPLMSFPTFNPVGGAIDSYSKLNQSMMDMQRAKQQKEMMPLQMQALQNELALQQGKIGMLPYEQQKLQAMTYKANQDAEKQRMMMSIINGGGLSSGLGGDSTDEMSMLMARDFLGLPAETPNERAARDRETHRLNQIFNKELETQLGTTSSITQRQGMELGIKNAMPLIDELIEFDVPGQLAGKYFSPDKQAEYSAITANITDKLITALGLPKQKESFETVKRMVEFQPFESSDAYKHRLQNLKKELNSTYSNIAVGQPRTSSENSDPLGIR